MDYETLDWMDAFDDSVFTDTIEANDTSALTGFENTETGAEASSPLEANETETETTDSLEADNGSVTQLNDDFFTNFTPTINFSMARSAGPSSMNNDASPKGDKPKGDKPAPGDKPKDDKPAPGGSNNNPPDDDPDIDLDDFYGGDKTDGDDDSDDDYGSWTDKDRAEFAKEVAEKAGKEYEAAAAESDLADKELKDIQSQVDGKLSEFNDASDKMKDAINDYDSVSKGDFANVDVDDLKEVETVTLKDGQEVTYYEYTGTNAAQKAVVDARNETIDRLVKATADYEKAKKDWSDFGKSYNAAKSRADAAIEKAKEALAKAQAAKDNAGTLSAEAKEAYERAEAKQKEWEQKQKDAEANEKGDNNSNTSNSNLAVNNPVTFDLAKTLADAGAKMTETEYGQVADFVAAHPELASILSGGLTNAEKSSVANVIAGIQAINAGNFLTAVKEFAQGFGMTLVSAVQLIASGIYGAGPRILGTIKSFMENPNINYGSHNKDFETFEKMRAEYGDSSELQALYDTAKGTTEQKQTFDYMKDNAATSVGEYNEGLVEDVNKVVSDASRKIIHYSPYVLEAVKKWRE